MRVLLIHDRPGARPGEEAHRPRADGVTAYLRDIARHLAGRGHRIVQLALERGLEAEGDAGSDWIARPANGIRSNAAQDEDILDAIAAVGPAVVHLHGIHFTMSPRLLRTVMARWPSVLTLHDVGQFCPKGTRLRTDDRICDRRRGVGCVLSRCCRLTAASQVPAMAANLAMAPARIRAVGSARRILCPSPFIADLAIAHGLSRERMAVLPGYSRFDRVAAPCGQRPRAREGRLLFVGRLEREKGFDTLLAALDLMSDQRWTLDVIGHGPLEEEARRRLGPRLHLRAPVGQEDLADAYRAADVAVLPYRMPESFGMVGVEALSQGCPVVGFPAGGAASWMRAEHGAVPVVPGNPATLARAIAEALRDPPQARAAFPFTLEAHLDGLERTYREARAAHV